VQVLKSSPRSRSFVRAVGCSHCRDDGTSRSKTCDVSHPFPPLMFRWTVMRRTWIEGRGPGAHRIFTDKRIGQREAPTGSLTANECLRAGQRSGTLQTFAKPSVFATVQKRPCFTCSHEDVYTATVRAISTLAGLVSRSCVVETASVINDD
jgi:hypothetical protein